MRCESAVRAVTSEDLLPSACQSPSAMRCLQTPINGLGGRVLHTVTRLGDQTLPFVVHFRVSSEQIKF
jgi:hypothetical protein